MPGQTYSQTYLSIIKMIEIHSPISSRFLWTRKNYRGGNAGCRTRDCQQTRGVNPIVLHLDLERTRLPWTRSLYSIVSHRSKRNEHQRRDGWDAIRLEFDGIDSAVSCSVGLIKPCRWPRLLPSHLTPHTLDTRRRQRR